MTEFTPVASTAGGLLIGCAAALLLLGLGRVAGISGILGAALSGSGGWRLAFLVGLPAGAWLVDRLHPAPIHVGASPLTLVAAGLLVGFGTQLGHGCTSGHGVCGLARGSRRSVVAVAVFMGTGFATVFVVRHLLGGGA